VADPPVLLAVREVVTFWYAFGLLSMERSLDV
jgi:hypothetical protein